MDNNLDHTNAAMVVDRIQKLEETFAQKVALVRNHILQADPSIKEKIEWNFPCFYIGDSVAPEDHIDRANVLIEMNLRHNKIILVFPTGTLVKGVTGIYEGSYKDGRRIVPMGDIADIEEKAPLLIAVIKKWIKAATIKK
jgi:hypothetical protein